MLSDSKLSYPGQCLCVRKSTPPDGDASAGSNAANVSNGPTPEATPKRKPGRRMSTQQSFKSTGEVYRVYAAAGKRWEIWEGSKNVFTVRTSPVIQPCFLVDLYVTVIQLGYHCFHIDLYVNLQIHDIT